MPELSPRVQKLNTGIRRTITLAVTSLLLAILLNAGFSIWVNQRSQHQWCTTLTLITQRPVRKPAHPAQNESREQSWLLYQDFLRLKSEFGCK